MSYDFRLVRSSVRRVGLLLLLLSILSAAAWFGLEFYKHNFSSKAFDEIAVVVGALSATLSLLILLGRALHRLAVARKAGWRSIKSWDHLADLLVLMISWLWFATGGSLMIMAAISGL